MRGPGEHPELGAERPSTLPEPDGACGAGRALSSADLKRSGDVDRTWALREKQKQHRESKLAHALAARTPAFQDSHKQLVTPVRMGVQGLQPVKLVLTLLRNTL